MLVWEILVGRKVTVNNAGYNVTISYTKVEVNKDVDPEIFKMGK